MLEALALEEGDTLDDGDEPLFDPTLPDDEFFQGAAGAIEVSSAWSLDCMTRQSLIGLSQVVTLMICCIGNCSV